MAGVQGIVLVRFMHYLLKLLIGVVAGSRFALLEIKTLFYHLLSKFEIVPVAKTQIPVRLNKSSYNLQPEGGFWLGFKPREEKVE